MHVSCMYTVPELDDLHAKAHPVVLHHAVEHARHCLEAGELLPPGCDQRRLLVLGIEVFVALGLTPIGLRTPYASQ